MSRGEFGAAGFFLGSEFHEFDAGLVGVVYVELPFTVAAEFGFFRELYTVLDELRFCGLDVGNTERDVVHDAEEMFVLACWVVDHKFEPISAIGHLERNPGGFIVFHSSMPVGTEAENVFVEMIHSGAILDDEPCVD